MGEFALLAPVPIEHLEAGIDICSGEAKVAFGSRAWEVFHELDRLRNGKPVSAYIHASMSDAGGSPIVTWHAKYIGHVESKNGAHTEGMRFRPPSTGNY